MGRVPMGQIKDFLSGIYGWLTLPPSTVWAMAKELIRLHDWWDVDIPKRFDALDRLDGILNDASMNAELSVKLYAWAKDARRQTDAVNVGTHRLNQGA